MKDNKNQPNKNIKDLKDDESQDTFQSSTWRMPSPSITIPVISVNEELVDLPHLAPKNSSSGTSTSFDQAGFRELMGTFGDTSESSQGSIRQRLIRKSAGDAVARQHLKLWRRKLLILIWLNFVMKYRRRFLSFIEIFFPIIGLAIIGGSIVLSNTWAISFAMEDKPVSKDSPFSPYNPMQKQTIFNYVCSNNGFCDDNPNYQTGKEFARNHWIVYSPNNSFVNDLMSDVMKVLRVDLNNPKSKFFGVVDSEELDKVLKTQWEEEDDDARYPYGISFSFGGISIETLKRIEDNKEIPIKLRYAVRTFYPETSNTDENFPFAEHSLKPRSRHEVSPYISTGFSGLQLAIDISFIERVKEWRKNIDPVVKDVGNVDHIVKAYIKSPVLQMFEYPYFLKEEEKLRAWTLVVLSIILSYSCTIFAIVQEISAEAKAGKMELLKLHGLTPALHWTSYAINACCYCFVTTIFLAIIIHYSFAHNSILSYDSVVIVWLFFFLHCVAQYTENLFLVLFFDSPTTVGMYAVFKSFAEFFLPLFLFKYGWLSRIPNYVLCVFIPQWCLANGIYHYLSYELYENGLDWYDFPVLNEVETYILAPIPICCILYVYGITIYFLLLVYCDRVLSKPYAPSTSWKYLWKACREPKPEHQKPTTPINYKEMPPMYERPPTDLKATIKVRSLSKKSISERSTAVDRCLRSRMAKFLCCGDHDRKEWAKSFEVSLDNISLDIFEGEILGVVGPAGSGKTHLLHLIAGLMNPTSGFVEMKNLKVHEYSDFLNQYISICTQQCSLFPTLSVEDHVRLCCMVHGNSYRKSKLQAKMLMQLFNLSGAKRHSYLWLSSTQIKKLSMAMALASSPTVLILDEPCVGMDRESSEQLWRYLISLKTRRTIIVSTTRLEEIELYCDRMLLLVKGKVVCYGTSSRIKRHYNIGAILNIEEGGVKVDPSVIKKIMTTELGSVIQISSVGYDSGQKTLRFLLPNGKPYAALLDKLEDLMEKLKIRKLWVSRTDLGALLCGITQCKGKESAITERENYADYVVSDETLVNKKKLLASPEMLRQERSILKQFTAMFMNKWLTMTQKHSFLITEFIPPIIFMLMMVAVSKLFLGFSPENLPRTIALHQYRDTLTLIRDVTGEKEKWFEAFRRSLGEKNQAAVEVPYKTKILEEINRRSSHTLTNSRQQTIIAIDRDADITTGFYSSNSYHSCPVVLNVMTNAILNVISFDKENPFRVRVANHPFPQYEGFPAGSSQSITTTLYAYIISIILAFIAAAELRLPLWEKLNGIKRLEKMAGVLPSVFWLSKAFGDFIRNAILTVILMGIVCLVDLVNHQFAGQRERYMLALIFFGYLCWSSIFYSYFLSQILNTSLNGYSHFIILHFVLGIFPVVYTYQINRTEISGYTRDLRYALHIFPSYTITSALVHYFHIIMDNNHCRKANTNLCDKYEDALKNDLDKVPDLYHKIFGNSVDRNCCKALCMPEGLCQQKKKFFVNTITPGLKVDLLAMVAQGIFFWILVIMTENRVPQRCFFYIWTKIFGDKEIMLTVDDTRDTEEPEDVKKEHQKVDYMIDIEDNVESEIFLVQDLIKFYPPDKCIDHIYFSIPVANTTGILGLAKSGMTTIANILSGELRTSAGYIYMHNERMTKKNRRSCAAKMGYCPQNNAYYPDLTGYQMLWLFASLRGVPHSQLNFEVRRWINILDLENDARIRCKFYRPGILRRLCCGMAMIGTTRVVIMDEPTIGMDYREKNIFWKTINEETRKGQTTLFTSTQIDEVRYCADKSIILDNGEILSIGAPEVVFKENVRGYSLSIRLKSQTFKNMTLYAIGAKIDLLKDHILRHLSPCELVVDEGNVLIYQLKDLTMKLSNAFGIMEGGMEMYPNLVDNFLVAESTLEDVILSLHKKQMLRKSSLELLHDDEAGGRDSI